jgi:uncharacterized repeat protein (TIGR04076 family)
MFQVRARVVAFLGNEGVYPCHFQHKVGDELIFDGESYHGRLCPDVWSRIVPKVEALHQMGPRYVEAFSYYPFWYCSLSVPDPEMKKYDGLGFRNVLKSPTPAPYDMATLVNQEAFTWPPSENEELQRQPVVLCPDQRTSMVLQLEAFDLSEKGFDVPYFRRQMAILRKLAARRLLRKDAAPAEHDRRARDEDAKSPNSSAIRAAEDEVACRPACSEGRGLLSQQPSWGGVQADKILDTFTRREIEEIFPPLGTAMVHRLVEELELMKYVATEQGVVAITPAGVEKLERFVSGLPAEHREAFEEYTP